VGNGEGCRERKEHIRWKSGGNDQAGEKKGGGNQIEEKTTGTARASIVHAVSFDYFGGIVTMEGGKKGKSFLSSLDAIGMAFVGGVEKGS